jgi:hypothetical protein
MDLKDFIKETISAIVESTKELQAQFEHAGVIVNPPVSIKEPNLYEHENTAHRYRRVETIEFDVAVTAATESSGGAKAGLKIFSAEVGADGKHARNREEVSRVKFSIPIVLSPADVEKANKVLAEGAMKKAAEKAREAGPRSGGPNSWMGR